MRIRSVFKYFIPLLVLSKAKSLLKGKQKSFYNGNYENWSQALAETTSYESEAILEKCKQAITRVVNGKAAFERDGWLFDDPQYAFPTIASLQKIAISNSGELAVLDFGGSLGSTYFQNRLFLSSFKSVQWMVVEQENFAKCGRENFENEQLKFYGQISEAISFKEPNVVLLSGVLQCLENPYQFIEELLRLKIPYILIDRTSFINSNQRLTILKVDENIYPGSYPLWFFNETEFLGHFSSHYNLEVEFGSTADQDEYTNDGKRLYWKGYLFKQKTIV